MKKSKGNANMMEGSKISKIFHFILRSDRGNRGRYYRSWNVRLANDIDSMTVSKFSKISLGIIVPLVILVLGWAYMWGPQALHTMWSLTRVVLPYLILFTLITALVCWVFAKTEKLVLPIVLAITGIGIFIMGSIFLNYKTNQYYLDSIEEKPASSKELSFRDRSPYDVASAVSNRTLGNTNGDSTGMVKALPQKEKNGLYTASVKRRGLLTGYESTQSMNLPSHGAASNSDVKFCKFNQSNAGLRFSGYFPQNNLWRKIAMKTSPSVKVSQDDAFVYCDGKTPILYAPMTKLTGFPLAKRVPAGVAIYNGETGVLKFDEDFKGDLPVYPSSVAEKQRNATKTSGSFSDYLFKRAGFDDTSKDEDDPNGDNRSEFNLASWDGKKGFTVTPLTPRGDSSSIVALSTTDSTKNSSGNLNPFVVHNYSGGETKQANSAIATRITGEILSGYKAQGLTVFEVVPNADGSWVASIGKTQSILYRAKISDKGEVTLYDESGERVGGASEDDSKDNPDLVFKKPLKDMSNKELKDAGNKILEELSKRGDE